MGLIKPPPALWGALGENLFVRVACIEPTCLGLSVPAPLLSHQKQTSLGRLWPYEGWLSVPPGGPESADSWSCLLTPCLHSWTASSFLEGFWRAELSICHKLPQFIMFSYFSPFSFSFCKECRICVKAEPGLAETKSWCVWAEGN